MYFYCKWKLISLYCIFQHGKGSEHRNHINHHQNHAQTHTHKPHQEDIKTKKHGEDDLPPEFKKKLTEWEIGKAMVGKSQQNVEELQKNLGEEFNKKMAEWEKIKASGGQIKTSTANASSVITTQGNHVPSIAPSAVFKGVSGYLINQNSESNPISPISPLSGIGELNRKGSANKVKKNKPPKQEKVPLVRVNYICF